MAKKRFRITFRSEIYVEGKNEDECMTKFEGIPLFSADALENYFANFVEVVSVEEDL